MIVWIVGFWGCRADRSDADGSDEVVFELQDSPVNSPLYTYPDTLILKDAMASFQLEPGLRIELVAAEPLVIDPVAFAFDENSVLYVAENRGYPDPAEGGSPTQLGRIARLEDRDGDGKYDHRTEFATGLTYPNGIMVWRGGVFVTCAPDIYYFKDKVVAPAEIPSMIRQRLMNHALLEIKEKAALLFNELEGGGRMAVYEDFLKVLEYPANAVSGKVVFEKTCSSCHSFAGKGGDVGPDLTGVRNQPADALLLHTIVPNYEVLPAYQATSISTKDGRSIAGWISSESDNSITLRTAFGTDESILRSNIVSIHHSGLSLMPDGLEQNMTKEDMANVIAYLKSGGLE